MKTISLLFIISLFINGVFGDEVNSVSVMRGDSVTLHTGVTRLQRDHVINWGFEGTRIAQINKAASIVSLDDGVLNGRFSVRLKLNDPTGDLTITNITTKDSGVYKLQISDSSKSIEKIFNVGGVSGDPSKVKSVSVMEEDSVTLYTDLTDIQKYDVIQWKFQHENSLLAELNRNTAIFSTYDDVDGGRFRDKLQLDQTGSLTIKNIRTDHAGLYEVDISSSSNSYTIHQSFTVTVRALGLSLGAVAGICVAFLIIVAGVTVAVIYYRCKSQRSVKFQAIPDKEMDVTEGDSVTLHTDLNELQNGDVIEWKFGDQDSIAKITNASSNCVNERFQGRLTLDRQTGDLTITNVRNEDAGVYHLNILKSKKRSSMKYNVIVNSGFGDTDETESVSVRKGKSVTLPTDITDIQRDDMIEWRFGPQPVTIAKITNANSKYVDERFRDRLTLNPQTGDLTITNIRNEDAGVYYLNMIKSKKRSSKKFNLIVNSGFIDSDKTASVSEMKGKTIPLYTGLTELQSDHVINWGFDDVHLAQINKATSMVSLEDDVLDGKFRDRLKLNNQTGDLTITNITPKDYGLYQLQICDKNMIVEINFNVGGEVITMKAGGSFAVEAHVIKVGRSIKNLKVFGDADAVEANLERLLSQQNRPTEDPTTNNSFEMEHITDKDSRIPFMNRPGQQWSISHD